MADKQHLKPGYFNEKPLLKAISQIKKLIGSQDSCLQTNQAAILFFEEQAIASENPEKFINEICEKFKISRGTNNLEYFKTTLYKSYILQTYNLVEPSLKKLNKQYRYYNDFEGIWKTKLDDKNLDPFNQLVVNLDNSLKNKVKSYPEYHLLNYYRLVRNSIVHLQEDEDEHKKTHEYFNDNLRDKLEYFEENYEIDAPNEPDNISFEDFMLYTRAIKYFSNVLNDICFPSITDLVSAAFKDKKLEIKLKACRNIEYPGVLIVRINNLHSYFQGHFGYHFKDLSKEFCRKYLEAENIDFGSHLQ